MATGDFKIFSGTRDAVTTTSFPSTVCVTKATDNLELILFTTNSCSSNPTDEKISVSGNLLFVLSLNCPALLVVVPDGVPFIWMLTDCNGSFVCWFSTVPEISMKLLPCAKE